MNNLVTRQFLKNSGVTNKILVDPLPKTCAPKMLSISRHRSFKLCANMGSTQRSGFSSLLCKELAQVIGTNPPLTSRFTWSLAQPLQPPNSSISSYWTRRNSKRLKQQDVAWTINWCRSCRKVHSECSISTILQEKIHLIRFKSKFMFLKSTNSLVE